MFPIVKYVDNDAFSANARNWPGFVQVKRNVPHRAAVVAQEAWEATHKMDPVKLFFRVFKRSKQDQREFEYMGHEVEVQAAAIIYGLPGAEYRTKEAYALKHGYGGLFDHLSLGQIEHELRARSAKARQWVQANLSELRKHDERRTGQ